MILVYPEAGEKVLLYKELLNEMEQEYAETNDVPYRGDRLKFVEAKGQALYFNNESNLGKDNSLHQYQLNGE